jgi:LacI family transcriptional regulator
MSIHIRDLAQRCGVSTATVSRVFNQHPSVKPATRELVLERARALGYAPQLSARRDCVAIVVEGFEEIALGGYGGMLVAALSREVFQRGYRLDIVRPADVPLLRAKLVRGVVACAYQSSSLAAVADLSGMPVVTVNGHVSGKPAVLSNDRQGLAAAVAHLASRGHRRIALLTRALDTLNNRERRVGFVDAMHAKGLDDGLVIESGECGVVEDVAKALRRGATAIVATGEELGLGLGYALQLLGRRVPEEVSAVGFEHRGVSCYAFPPQTTLEQDFAGLAAAALDRLEQPRARRATDATHLVDYRLLERESVGPVPPAASSGKPARRQERSSCNSSAKVSSSAATTSRPTPAATCGTTGAKRRSSRTSRP